MKKIILTITIAVIAYTSSVFCIPLSTTTVAKLCNVTKNQFYLTTYKTLKPKLYNLNKSILSSSAYKSNNTYNYRIIPFLTPINKKSTLSYLSNYNNINPYASFSTFNVKHEFAVPDFDLNVAVEFAVEDVILASEQDLHMPVITTKQYKQRIATNIHEFYRNIKNIDPYNTAPMEQKLQRLEVISTKPDNLVYVGADGVLAACVTAFSRHLPLALKPDHIWMLILNAVSQHVNQNSEELRDKFVSRKIKEEIVIKEDIIIRGATPPDVWEHVIFPKFSDKIKTNLVSAELEGIVTNNFSNTTPIEKCCKEIMLMGTTNKYFDFTHVTVCGIPSVKLLGLKKDWQSVLERTKAILEYTKPEFKNFWLPKLEPVLEKFIACFSGDIDPIFWEEMVNLRNPAYSCGEKPFISGWIQILYPYLADGSLNTKMKSWDEFCLIGTKATEFPDIITSIPVNWEYYNEIHRMHYHAGINGFTQDPKNGCLMPVAGWQVSYDDIDTTLNHAELMISADKSYDITTSVPVNSESYNEIRIHYHAGINGFTQEPQNDCLIPVAGWQVSYDDIDTTINHNELLNLADKSYRMESQR